MPDDGFAPVTVRERMVAFETVLRSVVASVEKLNVGFETLTAAVNERKGRDGVLSKFGWTLVATGCGLVSSALTLLLNFALHHG